MTRQENIIWLENRIIEEGQRASDRKVRYPRAVLIARTVGFREETAKDYVKTIVDQRIFETDGYSFIIREDQEPSPMNSLLKKNSTLNEIVSRINDLENKMDKLLTLFKELKQDKDKGIEIEEFPSIYDQS